MSDSKMVSIGRLYRREKNGKVYFTGNLLVDKLKTIDPIIDKHGNSKFQLVIFPNDYKTSDTDKEADYIVYESKPLTEGPSVPPVASTRKAPF